MPAYRQINHEMYMAPEKGAAKNACKAFVKLYESPYPKAVNCLTKDEDVTFSFHDFLAAHWIHLRTANPIESTFETLRLRTRRTKGCAQNDRGSTFGNFSTIEFRYDIRPRGHDLCHAPVIFMRSEHCRRNAETVRISHIRRLDDMEPAVQRLEHLGR